MKKLYILVSLALAALTTNAQLTLNPLSTTYVQNFDTIANGLPAGWFTYYSATSTSLGTLYAFTGGAAWGAWFDTTDCASDVFGHGFKNCASYDGSTDSMTCAQQLAVTNRALGIRQASGTTYPGYDPGVSFAFELANTTGLKSFNLAFELQGLDIRSTRTTTWTVDYGFGAAPTTFTPVTPVSGTMTSGNAQFTSNQIAVTFGSALDNQTGPVWIRISSLAKTSGSGSRTTSAIDNFALQYAPVGIQTLASEPIAFKTLGIGNANNVNFTCTANVTGMYSLNIYDITGRQICTKQVELTPGMPTNISVNDKNLVAGMYIARITDGNAVGITKVIVQ
jgi:hypothetical protein